MSHVHLEEAGSPHPSPWDEAALKVSSWAGWQQMKVLPLLNPMFLQEPGRYLWLQVCVVGGPSPSPSPGCLSDYFPPRHTAQSHLQQAGL